MNNVLCIVPARGGSKAIPRKNVRLLAGKPLLAYSIEQAKATPGIGRVVISTDDAEIAAVAREYGADVVPRPPEISGDQASSEAALLHTLDYLQDHEGYAPETVVFLQATSPLRRPDDIQDALNHFEQENADSLLSVGPLHGFVWRIKGKQTRSFSYDYQHRLRRQDAPEDVVENGSIYIFKPWVLREHHNRLGGKIVAYRMRAQESFQVDEPDDMELMEHLIGLRRSFDAIPDLSGIALLVLDFDGVLTDNRVLVDQEGREAVLCHRGDGWGLARLREAGIEVIVLSTEKNRVVTARCTKLGLPCEQACDDKLAALQRLAAKRSLRPAQIAFMGNDVNDLSGMQWAGLAIAVADAVPQVCRVAHYVTARRGGAGAVREVCDLMLAQLAQKVGHP